MKEIYKEKLAIHGTVQYLNSEVALMTQMDHPGIVRLYHYFEDDVKVYLILELADNGHLYKKLRHRGKLSEVEAVHVSLQVLRASRKGRRIHALAGTSDNAPRPEA